jgi:hypothetical protein
VLDKSVVTMVEAKLQKKLKLEIQKLMSIVVEDTLNDVSQKLIVSFEPAGDGTFRVNFKWKEGDL